MSQPLPEPIADRIAAGVVLAARAEPYLTAGLHALTVRSAPGCGVVAADRWWRLHVDADVCEGWTARQWATVLRVEIRRLLFGHAQSAQRHGAQQASRYAHASDLAANTDARQHAPVDFPFAAQTADQYPGATASMSADALYELLSAQDVTPPDQVWGSAAHAIPQAWEMPAPDQDPQALSATQSCLLCESIARRVMDHGAGEDGALGDWARELTSGQVDWRAALDSHVRAAAAHEAGRRDYTYSRPSRRRAPAGAGGRVILAGMHAPAPPRVAVIRDTSGSMRSGADLISAAAAEIDDMLRARARVTLIDTDDQAHAPRSLRAAAGQADTAQGGGGTDMSAGLDAAAALRPRPQLAVVMTDGMTPWPQRNPLRGVPVLVVLLGADARRHQQHVPDWARTLVVAVGDSERPSFQR